MVLTRAQRELLDILERREQVIAHQRRRKPRHPSMGQRLQPGEQREVCTTIPLATQGTNAASVSWEGVLGGKSHYER